MLAAHQPNQLARDTTLTSVSEERRAGRGRLNHCIASAGGRTESFGKKTLQARTPNPGNWRPLRCRFGNNSNACCSDAESRRVNQGSILIRLCHGPSAKSTTIPAQGISRDDLASGTSSVPVTYVGSSELCKCVMGGVLYG